MVANPVLYCTVRGLLDRKRSEEHLQSSNERMDQPGKVANPARGQLNRNKMKISLSPYAPERNWLRETGSAVSSRVSLFISILKLNLVLTRGVPPDFRGSAHLFI